MSILIKGMKMPTSCYDCDKYKLSRIVGCNHAYNTKNSDWGRALNCPLISVPSHGDLIERKAVGLTDFEIVMCDGDYKEGMKMLLEKIEAAPTIIPAEEGEK